MSAPNKVAKFVVLWMGASNALLDQNSADTCQNQFPCLDFTATQTDYRPGSASLCTYEVCATAKFGSPLCSKDVPKSLDYTYKSMYNSVASDLQSSKYYVKDTGNGLSQCQQADGSKMAEFVFGDGNINSGLIRKQSSDIYLEQSISLDGDTDVIVKCSKQEKGKDNSEFIWTLQVPPCYPLRTTTERNLAAGGDCLQKAVTTSKVLMISKTGQALGEFYYNPIEIISQGGTWVTFNVTQSFKNSGTVSWISIYYNTGIGALCPKTSNVPWQKELGTFNATCVDNFATIFVYVHDGSFGTIGTDITGMIPPICSASKDTGKKIYYEFKVPCVYDDSLCTKSPVYPTSKPTSAPTRTPTSAPTRAPTLAPTSEPTFAPTRAPTSAPTSEPTFAPTSKPTSAPTSNPTLAPTRKPTLAPSRMPTSRPNTCLQIARNESSILTFDQNGILYGNFIYNPIEIISQGGTWVTYNVTQFFKESGTISWMAVNDGTTCTKNNTVGWGQDLGVFNTTCINGQATIYLYVHDGSFTRTPDITPTIPRICNPSGDVGQKVAFTFILPCIYDGSLCTSSPVVPTTPSPTSKPTSAPSSQPTLAPTSKPTLAPTNAPTSEPTNAPTSKPTYAPTSEPTYAPTSNPTNAPTSEPTRFPTSAPTSAPTLAPTKCEQEAALFSEITMTSPSGEALGRPDSNPIEIITQGISYVTFNVTQFFKMDDTISWIAVFYNTTSAECYKTENVAYQQELGVYNVTCTEPFVAVDLYVHDGSFGTNGQDITFVPPICSPSNDKAKKVFFQYILPCDYNSNFCKKD